MAARLEKKHAVAAGSGRALLCLLLEALSRKDPDRDEVLVPGYTCYSVAAAVVRAGLRVRPIDAPEGSLGPDPSALEAADTGRVLALVTGSLFGIPDDLLRLESFCRDRGIALIDDAAQAFGARIGGRSVGSFGVAGLISLDKGKNVTSLRGGVLATDDSELADSLRERLERAPRAARPGRIGSLADLGRLAGYAFLLPPNRYWIAELLFDLGRTVYDPDFPIGPIPTALAPMALELLPRVDALAESRRERARWLTRILPAGVRVPSGPEPEGFMSAALRLPVLFAEPAARERAMEELVRSGLGASRYYPHALIDLPGVQPHLSPATVDTPRARRIAAALLTLPTHPLVTRDDAVHIGAVLERCID